MLRAPSLNLAPAFTASLADIVAAHLRGQAPYNLPTTRQYPLRCPGCVNQDCADSKEYFVTQSPAAVTQSVTGCGPLPSPRACCRGPEEFSVFAGALWKWRRQWRRRRDDSVQRLRRERAARDAFLRSIAIHLEHGGHYGNHHPHKAEDGLADDL